MGEVGLHDETRQRIDKWLYFARIVKTRSLAQQRVSAGHVLVNGVKLRHPSHSVRPGDRLDIALSDRELVLHVRAIGSRRGPYEEARHLYDDLTPVRIKPGPDIPALPVREAGSGRPTKKQRRALDELRFGPDWDAD